MANNHICIDEIRGCEGNCITINDYRVSGPKPWGGGVVVKNWIANVDDVIASLRDNDVVKVVRCKNCVSFFARNGDDGEFLCHWCSFHDNQVGEYDFCSYGEKQ